MTMRGGGDAGALARGLRREMTGVGLRAFAAKMLHAAILAPERLSDIYDNAAAGWLLRPVLAPRPPRQAPGPMELPGRFWKVFWSLVEMPVEERRRLPYTAQLAYLTGLLPPELNAHVAAAALEYPGVRQAAADGMPGRFSTGRLARCAPGSLGGQFYMQVLSRQAELEILSRDDLNLHLLPPPLDYLNARILQCHGVWRIAAGYGSDVIDEIGLAAFQMGQLGHHYSSILLAVALATAAFQRTPDVGFVLDTVLQGWAHGRNSPPLLGVDWEALFDLPPDRVRSRLGLVARSPDYDPAPKARRETYLG